MGKGRTIKSNKEKRTIVSNKRKERDQFKKEMDMVLLKNKINEMMKKISDEKRKIECNNEKYKKNIEIINEKYTDNILYQTMFQNYIKNEYTRICISFINKIILDTKHNHLEQYEGKYDFNKIFISITKELFLNQYELVLLSLYLEYIDLSLYFHIFGFEESILYLCFYIKNMTVDSNEILPILYHLNKKYENFEINYEKWYQMNEKKFKEKIYFHYREINKRFREYSIPFNEYCGVNYIDYNYIVDRILTMSLPYTDIKKDNNVINNDNNIDNLKNNNNNYKNELINDNNINLFSNKKLKDVQGNNNLNQNIFTSDFNFNNNNIQNKIAINDLISNNKNNKNSNNTNVTANNILHSLSINNIFKQNQLNKKMLVSNMNNNNTNNAEINNLNNPIIINPSVNNINNNLLLNPLQNQSQASLNFQQKPFYFDMNLSDKNINSHIFFDEQDELKKIIKKSSDDCFLRSSQSFGSPKFPYGLFLNNNNLGNINNIKNSTNTNNNIKNDNLNKKYKDKDIPFKPLNITYNKNIYGNIINNPKIIYSNNSNSNNNINNIPTNLNEK